MLDLRNVYEVMPLTILVEAVGLCIYSHDLLIVLKNHLTLTSSKATLFFFGSEHGGGFVFFFLSGGHDNVRDLL